MCSVEDLISDVMRFQKDSVEPFSVEIYRKALKVKI